MSFASMLKGLTDANVAFVVVGGVAAAAHGASRVTSDLEIVYKSDEKGNLVALANVLSGWDAYPRGIEAGLPFIMDQQTLHSAPLLPLTTIEGDIDVLASISGIGSYDPVFKHSEEAEAFDIRFRILDLPTLIKAKRAAGRPRDFEHLPEMEALMALRKKTR